MCAEVYFPIQFALLSKSDSIFKLKTVYSHPQVHRVPIKDLNFQGFLQCQSWLKQNIPTASLVPGIESYPGIENEKLPVQLMELRKLLKMIQWEF